MGRLYMEQVQQLWSIRQFTGGFKSTLKTHLFTLVDWRCCDFTVIAAPDTIAGFTYLLTYLLTYRIRPHIVSLSCDTQLLVSIVTKNV